MNEFYKNDCDTCAYNFIISGCPCCGKCAPDYEIDHEKKQVICYDYKKKVEV